MRARHTSRELVAVLLLAFSGLLHTGSGIVSLNLSRIAGGLYLFIDIIVIMGWSSSVRERLLPGAHRTYALAAASLMTCWIALCIFKHRMAWVVPQVGELCWYGYYIPQLGIPLLMLLTALELQPHHTPHVGRLKTVACTLVVLLMTGIITNGAHHLAFAFEHSPYVDGDPYTRGPLYYLAVATIVLLVATSTFVLTRLKGVRGTRHMLTPLLILAVSAVYLFVVMPFIEGLRHVVNVPYLSAPYMYPQVGCFTLLAVWEWFFRRGLLPQNTRYGELFATLDMPACITGMDLKPVYESSLPLTASEAQRAAAVVAPVDLGGRILHAMPIREGYVFWEDDVTTLRRTQDELKDLEAELAREVDLLADENELRERSERIVARTQLYDEGVAREMPALRGLARDVGRLGANADEELYRHEAYRLVLRAVGIKRSLALRLRDAGALMDAQDLRICIDDMLRILRHDRVTCASGIATDQMTVAQALGLFTPFVQVIDALWDRIDALYVFLDAPKAELLLTADMAKACDDVQEVLASLPPEATAENEEGSLYLRLRAEGGEAHA